MWTVLLGVIFGLLASSRSAPAQVSSRSCSHVGVFHVEGPSRYSLNLSLAEELCMNLNATIASIEEVNKAYDKGLQTCRYGWIKNGNTTILRQTPHFNCANNKTGVIIIQESPDKYFDAFCFDSSDLSDKNCAKAIKSEATGTGSDQDSDSNRDSDGVVTAQPETTKPDYSTNSVDLETVTQHILVPGITEELPTRVETKLNTEEPATDQAATEIGAGNDTGLATTASEILTDSGKDRLTSITPSVGGKEETQGSISEEDLQKGNKEGPSEQPSSRGLNPSRGRDQAPSEQDKSRTPLWLIIVAVVVVVCATVLVCAAIANRKSWCGQQQTLIINKDGAEGNGAAASIASFQAQEREQEMVTLMNKEKIQENGNTEEFTVITLEESPEKEKLA
ncbi:hypothetical protein UPYG_G00266510 [Umbra pygmaea]|uniref:CD44 antigen n=1 Tax=Umbra pygmaea TaxID=75934 RepID=A0ABD0WA06_UMBPY